MKRPNPHTGSVRLIDRRLRLVEVYGPEPPGSRGPTDRKLSYWSSRSTQREYMQGPQSVGLCFQADGRTAKFLVDKSVAGEQFLDLLGKHPEAPVRLAKPYGPKGWMVEG